MNHYCRSQISLVSGPSLFSSSVGRKPLIPLYRAIIICRGRLAVPEETIKPLQAIEEQVKTNPKHWANYNWAVMPRFEAI